MRRPGEAQPQQINFAGVGGVWFLHTATGGSLLAKSPDIAASQNLR